jgi:hypothetical protein
MPEKIDTFSIIRAMPFERLDDRVPYKKLIIGNYDTRFTADDRYEMSQIIWTAYAAISQAKTEENLMLAASQRGMSKENLPADAEAEVYKQTRQEMKADEWPFAPLNIVAETAEKLRRFLNLRFSMDEMYPISQEIEERYGLSSQQEPPPKKKHWWQR